MINNQTEKELFTKWISKRPELAIDGIINESEYSQSRIKVLYILKEVNDWKKGNLKEFVQNGSRGATWNNIARWQYGIENYFKTRELKFKDKISRENRIEILKSIAIVNLKKESGGSNSNMGEIFHHAKKDRELLKEQIKLYNADIVICCGTGNIVSNLRLIDNIESYKTTSKGIKFSDNENQLIIQYNHPQARKNKKILFNNLMDSIVEIKKSTTHNTVYSS
jgi:hypothetical protein